MAEEDAAEVWVQILGRIVTQNLPADEFTAARLTAYRDWRRDLGRAHSRLTWLFDPRRNPKLVTRDIRRTKSALRNRLDARNQEQTRDRR